MRKSLAFLSSILLSLLPIFAEVARASDQTKDDDRLRNCGTVLKEIFDVPDSIPQDLLDKADCVVVYPSVLKAAFIVGGSYGRGAMSCREGEDFRGPWGAPTMMALEGGELWFSNWRRSYGFCAARDEREGRERHPNQQSQAGSRRFRGGWPDWPRFVG